MKKQTVRFETEIFHFLSWNTPEIFFEYVTFVKSPFLAILNWSFTEIGQHYSTPQLITFNNWQRLRTLLTASNFFSVDLRTMLQI